MASRYGGNKQITGMGPNNEILLEYSVCDAIRAGFNKVVFIIRPDMLDAMKRICGDKLAEINRIAQEFGGENVEKQTFTGYIDKIWRECMADSDAHVVTAQKPNRSK